MGKEMIERFKMETEKEPISNLEKKSSSSSTSFFSPSLSPSLRRDFSGRIIIPLKCEECGDEGHSSQNCAFLLQD